MPVSFLSNDQRENYGRYGGPPSPHDLARYFHLDDTDHALIAQKRGAHNRLGFALQLGTVRYLGTFMEDPLAVPQPVLRTLAKQLDIEPLDKANPYSAGEQRWQHATEIRASYGYVEFTEPLIAFRLTRWLYALCWTGTDLAGSLKLGRVPAAGIMRTLQVGERPTRLAQAIAEFVRIDKALHMLTYIDDEAKRRGCRRCCMST